MANDIARIKLDKNIKNGTIIVITNPTTGSYNLNNNFVVNNPAIEEIENKYETRFDDPSYYYGIGNSTFLGV